MAGGAGLVFPLWRVGATRAPRWMLPLSGVPVEADVLRAVEHGRSGLIGLDKS